MSIRGGGQRRRWDEELRWQHEHEAIESAEAVARHEAWAEAQEEKIQERFKHVDERTTFWPDETDEERDRAMDEDFRRSEEDYDRFLGR